jgi:hypothetical protein
MLAAGAMGCSSGSAGPADASSDVVALDAADASPEASDAAPSPDASDASPGSDASDASKESDASDASHASDADAGLGPDAHAGDAASSGDGSSAGEGGAAYLCGSPPSGGTDDAGATQIIANMGSVGTTQGGLVDGVWRTGNRVLVSQVGAWALWDVTVKAMVTSGTGFVHGLAGSVFLVGSTGPYDTTSATYPLEARDLTTGDVVGSLALPVAGGVVPQSGLATDGSYFWVAYEAWDAQHANVLPYLGTWSATAAPMTTRAGNYLAGSPSIVAVPGELRIGNGPAGVTVIEHVDAVKGTSTTSAPFSGTFQKWFTDGARFLATAGTTNLLVYDAAATKLGLFAITFGGMAASMGGYGDYFYNAGDVTQGTDIYQVGGNGQPTAHYGYAPLWAGTAAAFYTTAVGHGPLTVVQMAPSLPTTTLTLPPLASASTFAADPNGDFAVGGAAGSLYFHGTSKDATAGGMLGCGAVTAIAGSASGTGVVATADGNLFVVDVPTATVRADLGIAADALALSSDGKTLAVKEHDPKSNPGVTPETLDIVSLPGGTIQRSFTGAAAPVDFTLSADGTTLARRLPTETDVTDVTGTSTLLTITDALVISPALSPSGQSVAATSSVNGNVSTRLYVKGTLSGAVSGPAIGWADDGHLVVQLAPFRGTAGATTVYDGQGNVLATPAFPILTGFSPVTATTLYSRDDGNVYDVMTAAVVSKTGLPGGVVAGSRVLALEGPALVSKPH